MVNTLLAIRLENGPLTVVVYGAAIAALVVLGSRRPLRRWVPLQLVGGILGFGVGSLVAYLVSDVWDTFDVSLSSVTRLWFGLGFAGIGFALAGLRRAGARRVTFAIASVVLFAFAGALGVNTDIAEFPTVGSALGIGGVDSHSLPALVAPEAPATTSSRLHTTWHAPADLPKTGEVTTVTIPATVSKFAARKGIVYLPPAALVADPPRLPVLELMSGQPGQPSDLLRSGDLESIFDSFAAAHDGLAPIVVIPDQLGGAEDNPMCVDSPLGDSATYLTVDVPNWIDSHLNVLPGRADHGIAGFSQGGTCSIQLGAARPQLYGSIVDISGQAAPHRGSIAATITDAFGGSASAYAAAAPGAILKAGAPFPSTLAIFVVGQDDTRYGPDSVTVSDAARAAGMTVHFEKSPGTAHDWHTVQFALKYSLPLVAAHWGLSS